MKKVFVFALFFFVTFCYAQKKVIQNTPWCGFVNPNNGGGIPYERSNKINEVISARLIDDNDIITIPVVFHIIYNTPNQNIPEPIIYSQMNRLNEDFRMGNLTEIANNIPGIWSAIPKDSKIQFKLACIKPNGLGATNGINRVQTNQTVFNDYVSPKYVLGAQAWDVNTYLNIWVCNLNQTPGLALFGYGTSPAFFTGSPNASFQDGITLHHGIVGDPNPHPSLGRGRVLTHEVGHWLGLLHPHNESNGLVLGCFDDFVFDTPMQGVSNINICPTFPKTDVCSSTFPGIMFMNYMDYSTDVCRYMFTAGQTVRMRSFIALPPVPNTLPSRNRCLRNYFGFGLTPNMNYTACDNGTFVIPISNPMCLPYSVSILSGDIEIVNQTDQTVVLKPKTCASSGNFTLKIISANFNYEDELINASLMVNSCSTINITSASCRFYNYNQILTTQSLAVCGTTNICNANEVLYIDAFSAMATNNEWSYTLTNFNNQVGITFQFYNEIDPLNNSGNILSTNSNLKGFFIFDPGLYGFLEIKLRNTITNISKSLFIRIIPQSGANSICLSTISPGYKVMVGTFAHSDYSYNWTFPNGYNVINPNTLNVRFNEGSFSGPFPTSATLNTINTFGCGNQVAIIPLLQNPTINCNFRLSNQVSKSTLNILNNFNDSENLRSKNINNHSFIWPNPAINFFELNSVKKIKEIVILSFNNSVLKRASINSYYYKFYLNNVQSGMYLLKIIYYDGTFVINKFIKI